MLVPIAQFAKRAALESGVMSPVALDWALLQAGPFSMLMLLHSFGRHPVRLHSIAPALVWRRADGGIESVQGDAPEDVAVLQREIMRAGLLVGEFADRQSSGAPPKEMWLLRPERVR